MLVANKSKYKVDIRTMSNRKNKSSWKHRGQNIRFRK